MKLTALLRASTILSLVLLGACTSTNQTTAPKFPVTPTQSQQLQSVVTAVTVEAMNKPRSARTVATVEELLQQHDNKMQAVLSEEQWATYDSSYRSWLAIRIQRDVRRGGGPMQRNSSYPTATPPAPSRIP